MIPVVYKSYLIPSYRIESVTTEELMKRIKSTTSTFRKAILIAFLVTQQDVYLHETNKYCSFSKRMRLFEQGEYIL